MDSHMGALKAIIILMAFSFVLRSSGAERWRIASDEEDKELERQLNIFNRTPIRTLQTKGVIYDCIDIYKQPALDHSLLTNHKIQVRPSYLPKPLLDHNSSPEKGSIATVEEMRCPQGTVPISRTQKEDLTRARNYSNYHRSNIDRQSQDFPGQHIACLVPASSNATYYGVSAHINTYSLRVSQDQYTSAQMWIEGGPPVKRTSIQAGWSTDGSKKGCFNQLCPGFVQVHPKVGPGSRIIETSTYGGPQYEIYVAIFQDKVTGNWWLLFNNEIAVGYWPKEIIPELHAGAYLVAWGGLAVGIPKGESPPMGNGHRPNRNFTTACYMNKVQIVNALGRYVSPGDLKIDLDSECYGLQYYRIRNGEMVEHALLFGGPGGNCGM